MTIIQLREGPVNLEIGDFINESDYFGDVWAEVLNIWGPITEDGRIVFEAASMEIAGRNTLRRQIFDVHASLVSPAIRFFQVRKIHKFEAPWSTHEARIVATRYGVYGEEKNLHQRSLPGWPIYFGKRAF
jgi:hypothetical protein